MARVVNPEAEDRWKELMKALDSGRVQATLSAFGGIGSFEIHLPDESHLPSALGSPSGTLLASAEPEPCRDS